MVEKIDRPEARAPYEIREPKESKEDQHHQQNQREEAEKKYKKQLEGEKEAWNKFGKSSMVIKPLRIDSQRISRCLIRAVTLHKGVGILQMDIIWKDGRKTMGALIRLGSMEEFIRLRKLTQGQDVPREIWARGPTLEIGIMQSIHTSGPFPEQGLKQPTQASTSGRKGGHNGLLLFSGIINRSTKKVNWRMVALYLLLTTFFVLAIVL